MKATNDDKDPAVTAYLQKLGRMGGKKRTPAQRAAMKRNLKQYQPNVAAKSATVPK